MSHLNKVLRKPQPDVDEPPRCIIKRKNGKYNASMKLPEPGSHYQFYIDHPVLVSDAKLAEMMALPGRRWFATDRESFQIATRVGANMSDNALEHWACLVTLDDRSLYWVGTRHVMDTPKEPVIIITVGEMYLKSKVHKARMFRAAVDAVIRVVGHYDVCRSADSSFEVRGQMPTEAQLDLIAILPGLAKIYAANARGTDAYMKDGPFGPLLRDCTGGLPVLKDQPVLCLLSGGIDSPVAAYKMMCRGCFVNGVHFLNSTSDTASVMHKNRVIAKQLSVIQGQFTLKFVDISKLQAQIVAKVRPLNRTVMYKWFMLHIGTQIDDSFFILVGDSAGQVASQTIANLFALYATQITKPVIAPLIGSHKTEIIDLARKIGTYEPSILEGADCCQYMMCKTGANLFIGKKAIRGSVKLISACDLPVIVERYKNGELAEASETVFHLNPLESARDVIGAETVDALTAWQEETGEQVQPSGPRNPGSAPSGRSAAVAKVAVPKHNSAEPGEMLEDDDDDTRPVYFDAAASAAPHPDVLRAMLAAPHGNPNSLHQTGRAARMAIERVRADIAAALRVPSKCIFFTSGGTEANNLALHGCEVVRDVWSHPSTIGNIAATAQNSNDAQQAAAASPPLPRVRVIDLVHHETGSVHSGPLVKGPGIDRLHVDATQAFCKIDMAALDLSQVDSLTINAHKINGPQGIGALYLRDPARHTPMFFGGSQENKIRPGTENVPAIVGFGAALRIDRSRSIHKDVEEFLVEALVKLGCVVNRAPKAPTSGFIVHATLPEGFNNVDFVSYLSTAHNVEIGTGSACKSTDVENVSTYEHLGVTPAPARRAIRLSYDAFVRQNDAEKAVTALKKAMAHFAASIKK